VAAAAALAAIAGPGSAIAVAATAGPAPGPTPGSDTLVLAFDTSRSVNDDQFAQAKAATTAVVEQLLEEGRVEIGLVAFGDTAETLVPPGRDRAALVAAIDGLTNDGGFTSAFDGLEITLDGLAPTGGGVAVFVTDGDDTEPDRGAEDPLATGAALAERARAEQVVVSAVTVEGNKPFADEFRQIVAGTGGQLYGVAAADDISAQFARELAAAVDDSVGPEPLDPSAAPAPVASAVPTPEEIPLAAAAPPGPAWPVEVAYAAAGAMFLAALIGGIALSSIAAWAVGPQRRRQQALEIYTPAPGRPAPRGPAPPTRLGDNALARQAVDVAGRLVGRGEGEQQLSRRLEAADLTLKPGEWVVIQIGVSATVGLLLLAVTLGNPVALVVGAAAGFLGTVAFLRLRADRRRRSFHAALPDTLQLLASTLRAGLSLPQAVEGVVREGREPIRTEFQRALVESRLGVPAERSLEDIANRIDSVDFRWVVMSIRIQREVGGNLAELLDTVAETMRERERLRRHVSALSAEGRLSAWIVGALPVVFVVYLLLARPGYLTPLVTDPVGILFLVGSVVLFVAGLAGLRWATKVEL
ncbi:MAG: type II secretion system F family protein, partial [Kineosporiaceae bacterium]